MRISGKKDKWLRLGKVFGLVNNASKQWKDLIELTGKEALKGTYREG